MHKPHLLFLLIVVALVLPRDAWSYGAMGHRVIGKMAQESLTPEAEAAVSQLLAGQSLADASTWADEMRSSRDNPEFWGYDHASSWHFINTAPGQDYSDSTKNPAGDAYVAILSFSAILMGQPIPSTAIREGLALYFGDLDAPENQLPLKQFALRFLVHLAGDLHQPLHVAFAEDRGGNAVPVTWFGRETNLHSVWDSRLLSALAENESDLYDKLQPRRQAITNGVYPLLPPFEWLAGTAALRDRVYQAHDNHPQYGEAYVAEFGDVAQEQLVTSAVRLAWLLNQVFRQR